MTVILGQFKLSGFQIFTKLHGQSRRTPLALDPLKLKEPYQLITVLYIPRGELY